MCRPSLSASRGIRPRPAEEGQSAALPATLLWQARDAARPRAGRRKDAGGRPRAQRRLPPRRQLCAGKHVPAARRARGCCPRSGDVRPRAACRLWARSAVRGRGSHRRHPATRHCRHSRTARPPAAPASPPPLPQHSQEQLEDSRKDQVVAAEGPAPAEQHHPRHGEGPAARPPAGPPRAARTPRSPGSAAKHTAAPRMRAEGGARRMRTPRPGRARAARTWGCAGGLYVRCARVRSPSC